MNLTVNQMKKLGAFLGVLSLCFIFQLVKLVEYSFNDEFFSYIPLIPPIALYLVWQAWPELSKETRGSLGAALLPALGGLAVLLAGRWRMHHGWVPLTEDYLTFSTAACVLFVAAGCLAFLGTTVCRQLWFPIVFLIFMIPMPSGMLDATTLFFQKTSAATAEAMIATNMPVFQDGLILNLPGFSLRVAPECSGIHSTLVLLITAALAGHLFLRSPWRRIFLLIFVIPLAILRNGFRIFTIGELCVRVSHNMIDSPIHHKGGPIFFAISLIPFFLVLYWLRKTECPSPKTVDSTVTA